MALYVNKFTFLHKRADVSEDNVIACHTEVVGSVSEKNAGMSFCIG